VDRDRRTVQIAIIFIGTFFQLVLMAAEDIRRVPMQQIEAAQTMGAAQGEILSLVILESAKPALLDTLRVTMGWAWTYLVVAELVAANSGLGYAILKAQRFLQTDKIFAGILLIGAIGLAMTRRSAPCTVAPFPGCTRNDDGEGDRHCRALQDIRGSIGQHRGAAGIDLAVAPTSS